MQVTYLYCEHSCSDYVSSFSFPQVLKNTYIYVSVYFGSQFSVLVLQELSMYTTFL